MASIKPNTSAGPRSATQTSFSGPAPLVPSAVALKTVEYPKVEAQLLRTLRTLLQSSANVQPFGLLCVRVDATEAVEALMGEDGVAELHREAFGRLRRCVRTTDLVSASQEGLFFILATDLHSEDELEVISERIQRTCRQPYWIHDQEIRSGLTTGGAGGSDCDSDPTLVTQHAVFAMRRAATLGVALEIFTRSPERVSSTSTTAPEAESVQAEAERAFEFKFHPQFSRDLALTGLRAEVRYLRGGGRSGRADRAVADRAGKNERMGDLVLRQLLISAGRLRERQIEVPILSIEIGANHLLNGRFASSVLQLLKETNTGGDTIEFLLTEATTLTSIASAERTLAELTDAGIRFGLCGFSLSAGTKLDLRKLPFTSLRVSCDSLFKFTSPRESLWLARSIVGVAERCGLDFIGQDVATESQRDILTEGGCEHFEGSLFSKPLGMDSVQNLLPTSR